MEQIELIINDIISGKLDIYKTNPIDSKQRSEIYEFVKKYEDIYITSKLVNGTKLKILCITKADNKENNLTPELIDIFAKYSRIPIPINTVETIDYYLKHLDKYYDAYKKYELFKKEIETKSSHKIHKEIKDLQLELIKYINNNDEFKKFRDTNFDIPKSNKYNIYTESYKNKWFVSIDVRSANFRVLKHYCPSICKPEDEWEDFIRQFTKNEFIIKSKQFREVVFGELGCKKIYNIPTIFINDIDISINTNFEKSKFLKKIFLTGDEIIYEVNEDFNVKELEIFVNTIKPSYFRVEMFKLIKIDHHDIYVKEYINGKREFKKLQKKFIMQTIKYYESLPIEELDRKFIDSDSGLIATFDKSLF